MNQPTKDGCWMIENASAKRAGIVHLATNDFWLPSGEAPYRFTDFDNYEWTYLGEETPETVLLVDEINFPTKPT